MLDLQRDLGLAYLSISHDLPVIPCGRAALVVCAVQAYLDTQILDTQIRREARNAVHRPGVPVRP